MKNSVHDVFLSHMTQDSGLSGFILRSMIDSGLTVFSISDVKLGVGDRIDSMLRESLVDSLAMVLLVTPRAMNSANLAVEVGMALAWSKPIIVLYDGVTLAELPPYLQSLNAYPVSRLNDAILQINSLKNDFKESERDALASIYAEAQIPTDQLLISPPALDRLTSKFNQQTRSKYSAQQLAHELIRMRKQGLLPRLKPVKHPA